MLCLGRFTEITFSEINGRFKEKWSSEFKQRLSANHKYWVGSRKDRDTRPPEQTREKQLISQQPQFTFPTQNT